MTPRVATALLLAVATASLGIAGCRHRANAQGPYRDITVGIPFDTAIARLGSKGQLRTHEQLATSPKPREIYAKLPADTEWRIWSDEGRPLLILGKSGGNVIYRQIVATENGATASSTDTLPEYQ